MSKRRHRRDTSAVRADLPKGWVTVYTDASHKDGAFGWAFWAKAERGRLVRSGPCHSEIADTNHAEAYAIGQAIHKSLRKWPDAVGFYVRSDSRNAIGMLSSATEPARVMDARLWRAVQSALCGRPVDWKWVRGHSSRGTTQGWLNDQVDQMSRKARGG